jgi:hypothetical protein
MTRKVHREEVVYVVKTIFPALLEKLRVRGKMAVIDVGL